MVLTVSRAATPPSGEPPESVCRRCGQRVDMAVIGPQVGLGHCPYCNEYACRWCWTESSGACPSCAFPYATAPIVAVADEDRPATTPRRLDRRAPLALGAFVVAIALLAFSTGGRFPPTTGFESGASLPAGVPGAAPGSSAARSPSGDPRGNAVGSASPATVSAATTPIPTGIASPAAEPTPSPTVPPPVPAPTPRRTPSPEPTPVCKTVPDLVGQTVASARAAWTSAGFTGSFNPAKGHDNMTVETQSPTAGTCSPTTAAIDVTYTRAPG